jgi:hypothetical protein
VITKIVFIEVAVLCHFLCTHILALEKRFGYEYFKTIIILKSINVYFKNTVMLVIHGIEVPENRRYNLAESGDFLPTSPLKFGDFGDFFRNFRGISTIWSDFCNLSEILVQIRRI